MQVLLNTRTEFFRALRLQSHSLCFACGPHSNADFPKMNGFMTRLILAVLLGVALSNSVFAQQSDPFAPAQPLADGWEKMDERLIFLMVRLVDVEANLDAVDAAIAKSGGRAASARSAANRAEAGSDRMDRRAGGPVRWDQFYGRTAEKFFYHPTQNHTYHTQTILGQQSPSNDNQSGSGVPSRQGLPVHQRPPQFDYMYRANENAKERATAEVAKIGNKIEALAARRQELELDQGKLWCEVAFRVVSRNDLDRQPLYRFAPKGTGNDDLLAATTFVTTALSIVESGESDQASAFRQLKPMISKARKDLGDQWLRLGVKYQDESSNEWRFATLARHLEDVSSNLSDSYAVSVDSAKNSEADRRDMYRGLLQKSLVQYAEAVLALNEMATELANAKSFEPDLQKELQATKVSFSLRNVEPANASGGSEPKMVDPIAKGWKSLFDGSTLTGWRASGSSSIWRVEDGCIVCNGEGGHLFYTGNHQPLKNFHLKCEIRSTPGSNSGIYFHTKFQESTYPKFGIEVQVYNSSNKNQAKSSSLYGLVNITNSPTRDGIWYEQEIIVEGKRVVLKVNGKVIVDYVEPQNQTAFSSEFERLLGEGTFALQSNSPNSKTYFRNIRVERIED